MFEKIYDYLSPRPVRRWILLLLTVVAIATAIWGIHLEEDITGFLPQSQQNDRVNFVLSNMKVSDRIIIKIENRDSTTQLDKSLSAVASEELAHGLDSLGAQEWIESTFYKVDPMQFLEISEFITRNIPYFLDSSDYRRVDSTLVPTSIGRILEANRELLISPMGMALGSTIAADPLHFAGKALENLQKFKISDNYIIDNDYIFTADGRQQLFLITTLNRANQTALNAPLVETLDRAIELIHNNHPELRISYFGAAAVAVTNAQQIKYDSYLSIALSMVLILGLMWYFFRSLSSMLLICLPVIFGGGFALAVVNLMQGSISAIALGAGSIIFGIAINYSIHFVAHLRHSSNVRQVITQIASPLTVGSLSTVGAFLSLLFISASAMRDFGLFAAFTLVGAILFVLIFLPHLVKKTKSRELNIFEYASKYRLEKSRVVVWTVAVLTIIFGVFSSRTAFETDMQRINYMTPEQRKSFEEISQISNLSKQTLYFVTTGRDLNQALKTYDKYSHALDTLQARGLIFSRLGIANFMPSDSLQKQKIEQWNTFWQARATDLEKNLVEQCSLVGFREGSFDGFITQINDHYQIQTPDYFKPLREAFTADYLIETPDKAAIITILYIDPQNRAAVESLLPADCADCFSFDSSSISRGMVEALSVDFNFVLYVCGFIVFALLVLSFGRLELALTAFAPMVVSWIWILGIMGIMGINFNIVNIILASFIFGLGDDFSIFITDGLMYEYGYGRKMVDSHKSTVMLSALTMLLGIGTLVFARHPAMLSLAQVTIIGMLSVVLMAYLIPPLIFNYMVYRGKGVKRKTPITIENLTKSVYAFLVFLIGSLILTLIGFVLLTLGRRTEANKLRYHRVLCWAARFVVRNMPMVTAEVLNPRGENFDRPAVIIANHQSHIDLMYMMMLSPKVVILTNDWVWRSPFYGILIRYADYYPVSNGIENSVARLRTLTDRGYSILIFPEGTRSESGAIGRFHRGAFYLAQELGVDLLPIVTHGIGAALPKSELLLRHGHVTISIGQRIKPDDMTFGEDYSLRSRSIRRWFKNQYAHLASRQEQPDYFRSLVLHNYIYKGYAIERQARLELRSMDSLTGLIAELPECGRVVVEQSSIGVVTLMIALVKKELLVVGVEPQDDLRELAANCSVCPENLNYVAEYECEKRDLIQNIIYNQYKISIYQTNE